MGMPVQVLPPIQGPPAPPPAPKQNQLNVNNANRSPSLPRKSPQSFEPPPMGCRPEIKIPSNPMANLRKVPAPKPKEANWVEEYRKERSVSPMPPMAPEPTYQSAQENAFSEPAREYNTQQFNKPTFDKVDSPINTIQQPFLARQPSLKESQNHQTDQNNNFSSNNYGSTFNPNSPTQRVYSPFASSPQPNLPKPLSPVKLNHEENVPIYVRSSQRATSPKPPTPQFEQPQSSPVSSFQRQPSFPEQSQTPTPIYTRSPRNVTASPVKQLNQSTFSQPSTNDTENYPIYVRSFQKQQAPAPPTSAQQSYAQSPASTQQQPLSTAQRFVNEPGRQYQQPTRVTNQSNNTPSTPPLANQQMPPWMRRTNSKELPEWANPNDELNRTTAPQSNQQTSTFTPNSNYSTNNSTTQYGNNYSSAAASKVNL